jgi:PPM family protein phosphatase
MSWFLRLDEYQEDELQKEFDGALKRCQQRIEACAAVDLGCRGMGTTLTMAYIHWPRLYVVHAGDSRCYLLRGGKLEQITTDQTVAQRLVESGTLTQAQAKESRWSHILWNCLGGGKSDLRVDVYKSTLELSDVLLLCTDGLTTAVSDQQVQELLSRKERAENVCHHLVNAANSAGGPDNITVVVAQFQDRKQQVMHASRQAALEVETIDAEHVPAPLTVGAEMKTQGIGRPASRWPPFHRHWIPDRCHPYNAHALRQ